MPLPDACANAIETLAANAAMIVEVPLNASCLSLLIGRY